MRPEEPGNEAYERAASGTPFAPPSGLPPLLPLKVLAGCTRACIAAVLLPLLPCALVAIPSLHSQWQLFRPASQKILPFATRNVLQTHLLTYTQTLILCLSLCLCLCLPSSPSLSLTHSHTLLHLIKYTFWCNSPHNTFRIYVRIANMKGICTLVISRPLESG